MVGAVDPTAAGANIPVNKTVSDSFAPMSAFFDEDNLVVQTMMANGYYDLPGLDDLTPYVGAGIGIGFINLENESNFAYQFMAGVSFKITDSISSNVGWTYLDAGEVLVKFILTDLARDVTHRFPDGLVSLSHIVLLCLVIGVMLSRLFFSCRSFSILKSLLLRCMYFFNCFSAFPTMNL